MANIGVNPLFWHGGSPPPLWKILATPLIIYRPGGFGGDYTVLRGMEEGSVVANRVYLEM